MKIGRYEILDEIGHGAMGTVYRARDPLIERTVAIKTVEISQLKQEGGGAEARFLREAQSAGRLSHPNIVTIYDVGEANGLAYIAMEHLSGTSLRDVMNRGPMPLDLVVDTVTQMAEALAFAHDHGVIHRDVKPANVVVTGDRGRVKLTDFGIAHLANASQTMTGQLLGSPRYMSPEQARGRDVDGRTDIFSLGAVLYEMLTGRYAYDGDSLATIVYRVIHDMPAPVAQLRPETPPALTRLLAAMLGKQPETRPDARSVVAQLRMLRDDAVPRAVAAGSSRVPRLLSVVAFSAPIAIFLLVGVGIIVIHYFLAPTVPVASAPPQEAAAPPAGQPSPESEAAHPRPRGSNHAPEPAPTERSTAPDAYLEGLDRKAVELRIRRTELLLEYTEQHPDVVQIERQLEQLRNERRDYLRRQRQ